MAFDNFKMLPGGLHAAVMPFDSGNLSDRTLLTRLLRDAIQHEAKTHGAYFSRKGFGRVMGALARGDIRAKFYIAAWNVCEPIGLGAQVECAALYVRQEGNDLKVGRGIYTEDVCIPPDAIRKLIADKPIGKGFPQDIGLGAYYDLESMKAMSGGDDPAIGRFGEISPHNTRISRILNQFGVAIGSKQDSAVLELNGLPEAMRGKWKPHVEPQETTLADGTRDPNNFFVSWASEDGQQQIVATYTKTLSTFTGEPIVRGQIVSNGNLPEKGYLSCVLASLIQAGEQEVSKRLWGVPHGELTAQTASPSIPLLGTKREMYLALVDASGKELVRPQQTQNKATHFFGGSVPTMRLHVLGEPEILSVLLDHGVSKRKLGPHAMQPANIDFAKLASVTPDFPILPARPLPAIGKADDYGKLRLSLAA